MLSTQPRQKTYGGEVVVPLHGVHIAPLNSKFSTYAGIIFNTRVIESVHFYPLYILFAPSTTKPSPTTTRVSFLIPMLLERAFPLTQYARHHYAGIIFNTRATEGCFGGWVVLTDSRMSR